jgi:hypothetical protein
MQHELEHVQSHGHGHEALRRHAVWTSTLDYACPLSCSCSMPMFMLHVHTVNLPKLKKEYVLCYHKYVFSASKP